MFSKLQLKEMNEMLFDRIILENFQENLLDLNLRDFKEFPGLRGIDIIDVKFIKLVNKQDAHYAVISYDKNEGEYLLNSIVIVAKFDKYKIVNTVKDISSVPDKTFPDKNSALAYLQKM